MVRRGIWSQTDEELAAAQGMTLPEFKRWQEIKCRPAIRIDDKDEYEDSVASYGAATGYGIKWGKE